MSGQIHGKDWVYVVVEDPAGEPRFVGLEDQAEGAAFIPVFLAKEAAEACLPNFPTERGRRYEVQAIHVDFLRRDARENGFRIYLLDDRGGIVDRISP